MSRCRVIGALVVLLASGPVMAQRIDSVRIFRAIPTTAYNTSSAESMAWRLHRERAAFVAIPRSAMDKVNQALTRKRPAKHVHRGLPSLSHLGFAFIGKDAHVVAITEDLSLLVDLTGRRQVPLSDPLDRLALKAYLVAVGL